MATPALLASLAAAAAPAGPLAGRSAIDVADLPDPHGKRAPIGFLQ